MHQQVCVDTLNPKQDTQISVVDSVVDRLRVLKGVMTYSEMEKRTGIHSTLLCRYVTGSVRPSRAQSRLIQERLTGVMEFRDLVAQKMVFREGGYLDMHEVLGNPSALRWIAGEVYSEFAGRKIDKVITAASSGIPLATAIALRLGADLIFATQSKASGKGAYYESELPSSNPAEVLTLYLPVTWIKRGDRVLVVDDVATTGRTMSALISLIRNAGCDPEGIVVLASRGTKWKERVSQMVSKDSPILVIFQFAR